MSTFFDSGKVRQQHETDWLRLSYAVLTAITTTRLPETLPLPSLFIRVPHDESCYFKHAIREMHNSASQATYFWICRLDMESWPGSRK